MPTYQSICRVQFNLQQELQQKILGASFWRRCSRRRVEISQGKYITVEALMEKVIKPFVTYSLPSPPLHYYTALLLAHIAPLQGGIGAAPVGVAEG